MAVQIGACCAACRRRRRKVPGLGFSFFEGDAGTAEDTSAELAGRGTGPAPGGNLLAPQAPPNLPPPPAPPRRVTPPAPPAPAPPRPPPGVLPDAWELAKRYWYIAAPVGALVLVGGALALRGK